MASAGNDPFRHDFVSKLARHDEVITALGVRMSGVEGNVRALQSDMNAGFNIINGKLDRFDSRPVVDMHKSISTVVSLATLFGFVITGIIYMSGYQFAGVIAEQKSFNERVIGRMDRQDKEMDKVVDFIGAWKTKVSTR